MELTLKKVYAVHYTTCEGKAIELMRSTSKRAMELYMEHVKCGEGEKLEIVEYEKYYAGDKEGKKNGFNVKKRFFRRTNWFL